MVVMLNTAECYSFHEYRGGKEEIHVLLHDTCDGPGFGGVELKTVESFLNAPRRKKNHAKGCFPCDLCKKER